MLRMCTSYYSMLKYECVLLAEIYILFRWKGFQFNLPQSVSYNVRQGWYVESLNRLFSVLKVELFDHFEIYTFQLSNLLNKEWTFKHLHCKCTCRIHACCDEYVFSFEKDFYNHSSPFAGFL